MSESPIQTLSARSSVFLVEIRHHVFECRKCEILSLDTEQTKSLSGLSEALAHLDEHVKARGTTGNPGALEAIQKLEACVACGGRPRLTPLCEKCERTGKNELGRKRKQ